MKYKKWLALVFILAGVILISYPLALQLQAYQEQKKLGRAFEEKLDENSGCFGDAGVEERDFAGESPLFKMIIPSINLEVFILPAADLEDIEERSFLSPVHMPGSPLPGETGNLAVAGHRFGPGSYFRHLDRLESGDKIILQTVADSFTYLLDDVYLTPDYDLGVLVQTDEAVITLITCHREGLTGYDRRLIVRGKLVP